MPKFLDVPSWYSTSGVLLHAWETAPTTVGKVLVSNGSGGVAPVWDDMVDTVNGRDVNRTSKNNSIYAPLTSGTKGQVLVSGGNVVAPGWGPKITVWQGLSTTIGNFITYDEAGVLFVWGNTGRAGLINREDPFDFCIIVKTKSENNAYYITINGSTVQRMSVATTSATISTQSASVITVLSILAEDVTQQ